MIVTTDGIEPGDCMEISAFIESNWVKSWSATEPEAANLLCDLNCLVRQQAEAQEAGIPGGGVIDFTTTNDLGRRECRELAGRLRSEAHAIGKSAAERLFGRIEDALTSEAETRVELERLFSLGEKPIQV